MVKKKLCLAKVFLVSRKVELGGCECSRVTRNERK